MQHALSEARLVTDEHGVRLQRVEEGVLEGRQRRQLFPRGQSVRTRGGEATGDLVVLVEEEVIETLEAQAPAEDQGSIGRPYVQHGDALVARGRGEPLDLPLEVVETHRGG